MELESKSITMELTGTSDIMFDRFYGQEKDTIPPEQKFYLAAGNKIVLPTNLYSFLFWENPQGAAKTEGKKGKEYIRMGYSHVVIDPSDLIYFKRNGKDIVYTGFEGNEDNYYISEFSPRTKAASGPNSIKQNLKKRPVLRAGWTLQFTVSIIKNPLITVDKMFNWFTEGGVLIGLGTYRPRFGRFSVKIV